MFTMCCAPKDEGSLADANDEHHGVDGGVVLAISPGRNESALTPGREKIRLETLVKSFATEAMGGVVCILVDAQSGKMRSAKYTLDGELTRLQFTWKDDDAVAAIFPISDLNPVKASDNYSNFGEAAQALLESALPSTDRVGIVLLRGGESDDKQETKLLSEVIIDLGTPLNSVTFATVTRILQLYSARRTGST